MPSNVFSESYTEARDKFLQAADGAGAAMTSYLHEHQTGPHGEPLYLDVARIGHSNARRLLIVGCGTHGIEGYSGSAAQTHWMNMHAGGSLPEDVAVIFFHAHNPWGFAHALRFTEENVDLNRNFVDFEGPLHRNPAYQHVHRILDQPEWNDAAVQSIFEALEGLRDSLGEQGFSDAFNGGQYSHADGIFYGGVRPQWSNSAFRRAVQEHVPHAESAALVDLHTGIGPPGGHVFLCFHPTGSDAYERSRRWWGERAVNREGVTHKAIANYKGLLVDAFVEMLPGLRTTAVVVEFGTHPRERMQRASMAARWLWSHPEANAALGARIMREIREAFYPSEPSWREGVLKQSRQIIDSGLAGLAGDVGRRETTRTESRGY
jgi:hypothetical protein